MCDWHGESRRFEGYALTNTAVGGVILEAYSPLVRGQRMDDPLLTKVAKKHNKTPAQVLLRWGIQRGFVILPKRYTLLSFVLLSLR